jgi:hypothetical protein
MTTLHEYVCDCGHKVWSRSKPPKPTAFIMKVPLCPRCKRPIRTATGQTRKHYTTRDLL